MVQLNDMTLDLGEKTNLALKQPDKVKLLRALLDEQIARGRSTPGKPQANYVKVVVDKQPGQKKGSKNKTKGKNKPKDRKKKTEKK